ncbi:hypothetical protein DB346_12940 [Verrucomicrobia bacterium LW23]|nr:hypothetical protein DB346_12940 [Verrucomicrobia bacterium LW23]
MSIAMPRITSARARALLCACAALCLLLAPGPASPMLHAQETATTPAAAAETASSPEADPMPTPPPLAGQATLKPEAAPAPAPSAPLSDTTDSSLDAEYKAQTGTAITIIFDNSGSMYGKKLKEAKQAFAWWLEKAPDSYAWSLITFEQGGTLRVPFSDGDRTKIANQVRTLLANTDTPIVRSLKVAMKQIKDRRAKASPYERHVVLLFTDGAENQDKGGNGAVNRTIREMRAENVEVVGIGYHGEGDYMRGTATRFYQANNEEALQSGLSKVDAEIDMNDDVKVTPLELEAMAKLPVVRASDAAPKSHDKLAATPAEDNTALPSGSTPAPAPKSAPPAPPAPPAANPPPVAPATPPAAPVAPPRPSHSHPPVRAVDDWNWFGTILGLFTGAASFIFCFVPIVMIIIVFTLRKSKYKR